MPHKIYSWVPSPVDDRAADMWQQFQTNIDKAAFDRETITIGGGDFSAVQLRDMVCCKDRDLMRQSMALSDMRRQDEENGELKKVVDELAAEVKNSNVKIMQLEARREELKSEVKRLKAELAAKNS